MSPKIFDYNLVAIFKSKVTLMLSKTAYTGMCILELSKVLIYGFHYNFIKNKYEDYYSQTPIVYCMKSKLEISKTI